MSTPESAESTAAKVEEEVAARIAAHTALYGAAPDESTVDVFRRSARAKYPGWAEEAGSEGPPCDSKSLFTELAGLYLTAGWQVLLSRDVETGRMSLHVRGGRALTDEHTEENLRVLQQAIAEMSGPLSVGSTVCWVTRCVMDATTYGAAVATGRIRSIDGSDFTVELPDGITMVIPRDGAYASMEAAQAARGREIVQVQRAICKRINNLKEQLRREERVLEASRAAFGDPTAPEELRKPAP